VSEEKEDTREIDVAGRIYKIEMRQAAFEKFKASVEVVAIVLAGVWAFYQFIYEDKIKPFSETPSLTVTVKLEKLGTRGGWQAFRGTETLVNDSRIRVSILARTINIVGVNVVDKPKGGAFALQGGAWNVNNSYQMDKGTLLQSHSLFYSGDARTDNRRWWLQPGDTSTQSAIYFVKTGRYDVIRFETNYQYTKFDVVPPFKPFLLPNGDHAIGPADYCVVLEESPKCPVTGVSASSALSLW
jgi:hypothetical protein